MKFVFLLFAVFAPSLAFAWSAQVVYVHDGDSIHVVRNDTGEKVRIRVFGVDCPEIGQPYGVEARELTRSIVDGQQIEVVPTGQKPSYGREVAGIVILNKLVVLQEALVSAGLAWVDGRYCKSDVCGQWRTHQKDAKTARRGLWEDDNPTPPWTWRRMKK